MSSPSLRLDPPSPSRRHQRRPISLQTLRAAIRPWLGAFVVICALFGGAGSLARATAAGTPAVEVIRTQMEKGQGLFLAGKYGEAARVFEEGFALHPYSAFLFNAGVCYQKNGDPELAVRAFERYLAADPRAPDADSVRERIESLEAAIEAAKKAQMAMGGASAEDSPAEPEVAPMSEVDQQMKSLVIVETDPPGAPIQIHRRERADTPPFSATGDNPGWTLISTQRTPVNLTLEVGRYHVVVEKFRDFNRSETDIDVSPGHVHHFQANLSQGAFMGFLRVSSNVEGATVHLDDPKQQGAAWGRTPHAELVSPGMHEISVQAPGYQTLRQRIDLTAGDQRELVVELVRVHFGVIRMDANVGEIHVSVDGRPVGIWRQGEEALEIELPSGQHHLLVTSPGHKDLETTIDVPRGQVVPMRADMIPTYPRGTAWTQAGISAVLFGAGAFFGIESNRLDDQLAADRAAGYLEPGDPRVTRGRWYSVGANVGFAFGGLFAALSTYNFVKDPYPDSILRRGAKREFEAPRQPSGIPAATAPRDTGANPPPWLMMMGTDTRLPRAEGF